MIKVIFGPPGTGKTTHLLKLIEKHRGQKICFLTFTKAAAEEIKHRAKAPGNMHVSTIHSLAFSLTKTKRSDMLQQKDMEAFGQQAGVAFSFVDVEDAGTGEIMAGDEYLALYNLARAECLDPLSERYLFKLTVGTFTGYKAFVENYIQYKTLSSLRDFPDILEMAMHAPKPLFDVFFIDEAQDLSKMQWALVNYWTGMFSLGEKTVYVAGDDDQSIYVWGGAHPGGMEELAQRPGVGCETLKQSWRIPKRVHDVANRVISNVSERQEKVYLPRNENGSVTYAHSPYKVELTPGESTLFLYRNHSLRNDFVNHLMQARVKFVTDNGPPGPLQNPSVRAALIWKQLHKIRDGHLKIDVKDAQLLTRHILPSAFQRWSAGEDMSHESWYDVLKASLFHKSYLRALEGDWETEKVDVHLSSIHGSKGREADHVVLLDAMALRTASEVAGVRQSREAEARVFYVGVTRARQRLTVVTGERPFISKYCKIGS